MIYSKTEAGQAGLQARTLTLTPRQRSAFIMFDGKRSVADVLKNTAGLGVTADDVKEMVALGLLAPVMTPMPAVQASSSGSSSSAGAAGNSGFGGHSGTEVSSHNRDGSPTASAQAHYSRAYPIATRLTAALGLRGFRLNLAVEAAGDLDKLRELAPRIKEAVGADKFRELEDALYD